jgi:hypothetical protein
MKAVLPGLALLPLVFAGCDSNTAEAPPPGDVTPIVKTSVQGKYLPGTVPPTAAPATTTGKPARAANVEPGAAATPKPGGGDWLWKGYRNPLDRPTPKKR